MSPRRPLLSRILLLALITGVLAVLPAGPGQALYPGVTVDDFGGTRLATPIIAYAGGASGSISGGTLNLQLGGDLPNSATVAWVMPSPQDFTVSGKATNLRLDYTVATTTNSNPGAVVATMGATLTDASSRISTAYFSIPRGGTVNSIPFKQSGTGFPDTVDLTRITSLQITFFPGQTVSGGTLAHNLSIDRIWTMNLDTSIPQNISFTTTAPSTAGVGGAYIVSATGGGSGNPVTFSVGAGTTNNACTVSGSTVTFRNQGTCVVAADQAAGYQTISGFPYEVYSVAPTVTQTIAVTAKTNQTIAFISPVPGGATVGGTTTVTAGGGASGNPVTFSVGSATTNGACTVSGSTVTYRHVGTCAIAANQAGNSSYNPAPEVVQTFPIGQGSQTLAFTSTAPSPGARGVPYLPTVSGGASGQPIVLSVSALSTTDACTINAGSVSFDRPGTCVIAANQGGNADYTAAAQITQTITVAKYSQAISFTTTPPSSPTVESPDYAVGATGGGSGNAVRFGIGAGTTNNACSLTSSGTVSFDHAGTCIVTADQDGDASYAAATSASQTITVGKAAQTITFGAGWPTTVDLSAGAYLPSASGGGSGNAVRFDIGAGTTNNACSLARSGAVSFDNAGICVVTADQDGDDDHLPAPQDTRTITVTRIAQPLAFTSTAPTSPAVGATPYGVAASGGASGQPVRFGIGTGTTNNACSISGSTVSFVHAGTCVITADQDGDARYAPATRATQTISVVKATQSVSFVSSVPADPRVGGTYLATTTGGNSGNAVRLGIGAGTTKSACSLTPTGSISLDHAGVCVLTADQDGTDDYLPAPQATQQFTVAKVGQVISFLSSPPTTALVGGSYTVSAQTGLGTTVVLGIGAGTTNNACTLSGSTVTFAHAGTCVVTADQGGDDDREAATQATQSFSVGQAAQSVAFTSTAPTAPAVGATPYLVTATGGASGQPVRFGIGSGTTNNACTLSGSTVTFAHAGTCIITADQDGTADYTAATQKTQTITVTQAAQSVAFTSTAPSAPAVGATPYLVTATGGASGQPVRFGIGSGTTNNACTLSGSTVTFAHAGTCIITADQDGTADYTAATQKTQTITVTKAAQSVAFTSTAPTAPAVGATPYLVTATGGASGQPVRFGIGSGTTNNACTLSGSTVTFAHAGTCIITADQDGTADYTAATQRTQTITVTKAAQTLGVTTGLPASGSIGDTTALSIAAGGSSAPVRFAVGAATTASACRVSAVGLVTFDHAGTCAITVDQDGDADHTAATQVVLTASVVKTPQALSFTSVPPTAPGIGDTYLLAAKGGASGQPVRFAVGSDTTGGACSINGSTVSFSHAGTCVITADQDGDADHTAATQISQRIVVARSAQTITFLTTPASPTYAGGAYAIAAAGGGSGNPVLFAVAGGPCTVFGPVVTFTGPGVCEIAATQAGDADHDPAPRAVQRITAVAAASDVAVRLSAPRVVSGQVPVATVRVTPVVGAAAGTVQMSLDGAPFGVPLTLSGGEVEVTLPDTLAVGEHAIGAAFAPSDTAMFAPSSGESTLSVDRAATRITASVDGDDLVAGVAVEAPGAGTPTGQVRFSVDGTVVGTVDLVSGTARLAQRLTAPSSTVAVEYLGDDRFQPASSSISSGPTPPHDPRIVGVVKGRPGATRAGWFRGRVIVGFRCTAQGSPLLGACPGAVVLRREGADQSVTRTVRSQDGGIATVTVSGVDIDRTAPRVRLRGVRNGASYVRAPRPTCRATDALSGVTRCVVKRHRLRGGQVRFVAIAKDAAGNRARRAYVVVLRPRR